MNELMLAIEWLGAVALGLSILWYPAKGGWRRLWAPGVGVLGCLGFLAVGVTHEIWGVAALNGLMVLFNGYNLTRELQLRRRVKAEVAKVSKTCQCPQCEKDGKRRSSGHWKKERYYF